NSERYSLRNTEVSIDDDYFIPLSKLKQIRREFWNWFNENFSESSMHSHIYKALESFQKRYSEKQGPKSIKEEYSVQENITDRTKVSGGNTIKVHTLDDFNHATDEIILPNYCFEQNLPIIQRKIRKAVTKGKKRFRITSLYQFELLKSFNNIKVCTSYPLPISNSISADEVINIAKIMKLKLNHVQGWVELEKKELEKMIEKTQVPVEIYYYGRLPVFVSRAYMPVKGKIADGKGNIFFVVADSKSGLVYLYPEKVLSIPHIPNTSIFKDLSMAEKDEKNTSSFNFEHTLL
ncbi:MAG: DUF3656 domain-containing protein, partial [Victivallales bacterium]|nr:DUF3656 domain-containing protein [Victivallales bacterium]